MFCRCSYLQSIDLKEISLDNVGGLLHSVEGLKSKYWDLLEKKKFCLKTTALTPSQVSSLLPLNLLAPQSCELIPQRHYMYILAHLFLRMSLWRRYFHCPYFKDEYSKQSQDLNRDKLSVELALTWLWVGAPESSAA